MKHLRTCAGAIAFAVAAAGCSSSKAETAKPDWTIQPGVGVLIVTQARPSQPISLYDADNKKLLTVEADQFGQASFSYIPNEHLTIKSGPGTTLDTTDGTLLEAGRYTVRDDSASPKLQSEEFKILNVDDVADASLYDQPLKGISLPIIGEIPDGTNLKDGFQYLTMRDGTKLSAMVRYPDTGIYGNGPWPTVIETSGYGISNPEHEEPGVQIARAMGYATVAVNMRGTGCSGGIFDVFNRAQMADGYDIVEIVARQPWVLNGKPGMVGLSYSGITQLYTASTNPPHLAAVTPQSVIVDPWRQQWPGGIYNAGFTRKWLEQRDSQAAPNGFDWVKAIAEGGDSICAAHQQIRNMNVDFEAFGRSLEMRPEAAASRDLSTLVPNIAVPVYLTGAFQDEQVGIELANMIDKFERSSGFRAALWNGRHPDGYAPTNLNRMFEFLEFYVAKRVPKMNSLVRSGLPTEMAKQFRLVDATLEADRFSEFGEDYQGALAKYEGEQRVRVTFETGAGTAEAGDPAGTFVRSFDSWPPDNSTVQSLFAGPSGDLTSSKPLAETSAAFRFDPNAATDISTKGGPGGLLDVTWNFEWDAFAKDKASSFVSAPFEKTSVIAGPAEADLWIAVAGATDADIQVTLSEIRPDGTESLLQNGLLRLGHRALEDPNDNSLTPKRSFMKADYQPTSEGEFVRARIAIPAFGAPIRAGSRLKMTVSSPGRNYSEWTFENNAYATGSEDGVQYQIGVGGSHASALRINVLNDPGEVPSVVPPCPSLRGQACRTYTEPA